MPSAIALSSIGVLGWSAQHWPCFLMFYLISHAGASRASVITYITRGGDAVGVLLCMSISASRMTASFYPARLVLPPAARFGVRAGAGASAVRGGGRPADAGAYCLPRRPMPFYRRCPVVAEHLPDLYPVHRAPRNPRPRSGLIDRLKALAIQDVVARLIMSGVSDYPAMLPASRDLTVDEIRSDTHMIGANKPFQVSRCPDRPR